MHFSTKSPDGKMRNAENFLGEGIFMAELYRTEHHPNGFREVPEYVILCGLIYQLVFDGEKKVKLPHYIIREEGRVFRTPKHPDGYNALPQYEIKGYKIYRTAAHEDGPSALPDYIIR